MVSRAGTRALGRQTLHHDSRLPFWEPGVLSRASSKIKRRALALRSLPFDLPGRRWGPGVGVSTCAGSVLTCGADRLTRGANRLTFRSKLSSPRSSLRPAGRDAYPMGQPGHGAGRESGPAGQEPDLGGRRLAPRGHGYTPKVTYLDLQVERATRRPSSEPVGRQTRSPGRQPWDGGAKESMSPVRGGRLFQALGILPPLTGLGRFGGARSQGSRPGLRVCRPTG